MKRPGISLLEVLISMFILMIGLLGVGALIPVGRLEVGRGDQYDRAGAVGRAAFRELHIRGFLMPAGSHANIGGHSQPLPMWMTMTSGSPTATVAVTDANGNCNGLPITLPNTAPIAYCLDPWGMMTNVSAGTATPDPTYFPAFPTNGGTPASSIPYLTRMTVRAQATTNAGAMTLAMAANIFQSESDLVYSAPLTGSGAAEQQFFPSGNAQKRLSDGNYSWLATIVPNSPTLPGSLTSAAGVTLPSTPYGNQPYIVSTVVYYKRGALLSASVAATGESVAVYPERQAIVRALPGAGITGGDITLSTSSVSPSPGPSFLNVKVGQWLMLCGQTTLAPGTAANPVSGTAPFNYFRWYRIVAADDIIDSSGRTVSSGSTGPYTRNVTVFGPDWPASAITGSSYAIICDGVVAVFEKEMPLERKSLYSTF